MTIRIAHLSDIHFGAENVEAVEASLTSVEAFVPHLVVVTGDLTLNGQLREFAAAHRWLARLPRPRLVTPGNHDTPYWNPFLRVLAPFERYRRFIGPPAESTYDGKGLYAHAINTARGVQPRPNWAKGAIDLQLVGQFAAEMSARPAALKLFACHHPLIDQEGMPVTGGVHCGPEAARILSAGGVDLILTGHVHNPFALALPGERPSYAVGAGTLSQRTRGTPCGFNTIVADKETISVTAWGWNGTAFAADRVWPLERAQPPSGEDHMARTSITSMEA